MQEKGKKMNYDIKKILLLALFCCVLGISACGKMSDPRPLENSGYPHTYPKR